jgi:uncharacterized NAD(P)/FAD-binding protein YdhS
MRTSVAIIGAGFSGTLTAIHVARNVPAKSKIDIYLIDPRGTFGPGLAYSPPSERFKLNVRAQAMGAFPDDVEGFYRWLKERHPNTSPDDFASRLHYGAYLTDILNEACSRPDSHCLHRMSDQVVDMTRESLSGRWELTLKSGSKLAVDACVLAIGNLMQTSSLSRGSTNGFRQPFDPKSYEDLASREHVFILGASLTAIDVVLECEGRGFKGSYTLLSRHGRFPRSHEELPASAVAHLPSDWDTRGSVRALVETIRAESHRLGSSQPVFDAMRPKIQSMWQHLSLSERKRFLRHVRPMWDVHRHRIPSKHAAVLEQLQSSHRLQLIAGRLVECKPDGARLSVAFRERGPLGAIIRRSFDVAFRCTGPEADITKTDSPLLKSLCVQNLIEPGPLGLGPLRASEDSIPLWLMGPLQRENLFEITAVREIRQQAYEVATEIQDFLATATTASNQ